MYKIIGADQKEYGPVSGDELRQWIRDGRVNAQTQVEVEGQWKALGDIPEFAALLPQRRAAPMPAAAPAPSGGSGLAITSLILGILSVITCGLAAPLAAPIGLILGIVALNKSKNNGSGRGLALSGTIVSGIALVLMIPMGAAMFIPAVARAKQNAQSIQCLNNEKQLSLAIRVYSANHGNHFPSAATWCDDIKTEVSSSTKVFQCGAGDPTQMSHYAFNSKLDGKDVNRVAPDTVMIFETAGGWNQSGGRELLLAQPRHTRTGQGWVNVAFVDGSVRRLPESQLSTLRWEP